MQVHARNTATEEQLLYASSPVFQRPALEADSCRKYNSWTLVQLELRSNSKLSAIPSSLRSPYAHYQNRVFMRNERINARFFCIFDVFMRWKSHFFAVYPQFWRPFWRPHLNIFPLMIKALRDIFSKSFLLSFKIQIYTLNSSVFKRISIFFTSASVKALGYFFPPCWMVFKPWGYT